MAFSTVRGRPRRSAPPDIDFGTPELRLKHALGATTEPIDLCLNRALITEEQHWSALHLRWLYTLRYGAPSLTTHYTDRILGIREAEDNPEWRELREREYHAAIAELHRHHRYEAVMRVAVFNELPVFLSSTLQQRAWQSPELGHQLLRAHHSLREGLEILSIHWRRQRRTADKPL